MGTFYFLICRCTFLLLFLVVTHGDIRCKTTEDCNNPEVDEFCDENFLACEPCSEYCSGGADDLSLCMKYCPSKYSFSTKFVCYFFKWYNDLHGTTFKFFTIKSNLTIMDHINFTLTKQKYPKKPT